jgi:hypothetical protein
MINKTRKKYRNQRAGAEYMYSRSKRKCPRVWEEKDIDTGLFSNYIPKAHLKNCSCNAIKTNVHYDTRFFNCNKQKGVTLKSPRHANGDLQKNFISDVFELYKARDPLHPKFDKTLLNRLFTKYNNLNIDPFIKQFVIDYIQDVMEMGRSFDPSEVPSPGATVQAKGVDGEKYAQFIQQPKEDELMDSKHFDKIINRIEQFKLSLQEHKGYEFRRAKLEKSLKESIKFFEHELGILRKEAEIKVTDKVFKNSINTIAARVEQLSSTRQADAYVKYALDRYKNRKEDIVRDSFDKKIVTDRAKAFIKQMLDEVDENENENRSVRVRRNSNSDLDSDSPDDLLRKVKKELNRSKRGYGDFFYENYKDRSSRELKEWYRKKKHDDVYKIARHYLDKKHPFMEGFNENNSNFESSDDNLESERNDIKQIFRRNFNDYKQLNKALNDYDIGGYDENDKESQKENYRNYLDFFKDSNEVSFIKRIHKKFNEFKYNKRKLTEFLPHIYEKFE